MRVYLFGWPSVRRWTARGSPGSLDRPPVGLLFPSEGVGGRDKTRNIDVEALY
jgi:hypothetical protein